MKKNSFFLFILFLAGGIAIWAYGYNVYKEITAKNNKNRLLQKYPHTVIFQLSENEFVGYDKRLGIARKIIINKKSEEITDFILQQVQ